MPKKRKRTDPDDIDSIRHARSLVRKAWAEQGIEDPDAHVRVVLARLRAELAELRGNAA